MWWLYFDRPGHEVLTTPSAGFVFGYGHYLIFAAVAAVGAGIAVNVDVDEHIGHLSPQGAAFAVAVPVAIYLVSIWKLHHRLDQSASRTLAFPAAAVVVLVSPLVWAPITVIAVTLAALVTIVTVRPNYLRIRSYSLYSHEDGAFHSRRDLCEVERQARTLGVSRSEFFTTAARRYLAELEAESFTSRIDAVVDAVAGDRSNAEAVAASRRFLENSDDEW